MQVQVIKKPLKYGGRQYHVGEPIDMASKHVKVFLALRRVRLPPPSIADIPAAPSVPVTIVETRVEPAPEVSSESVPEIEERRPRRQYRRRDVKPENRDPQVED